MNPKRLGLSFEISQLLLRKALFGEFEGKILNPLGVEIDLPFWVLKLLKKPHLVEREPAIGKQRIQACIFGLMEIWDGPDFRPDRRYRAFHPEYHRVRSTDSGYSKAFLKAQGRDCSGLKNIASQVLIATGAPLT